MSEDSKRKSMLPPTLCWDCAKATGRCRWSKYLKPVQGWEIIPTKKINSEGHGYQSCVVLKCPEFEQDAVGAGTKRYKDGEIYVPMSKNT